MRRVTFSIPSELKEKLDRFPEVNWPEIAKRGLKEKLDSLERLEDIDNRRSHG